MEEAVRTRLLASSGVTDLVSTRIRCGSLVQGETLPAVIINRVTGAPVYTDDGESGLAQARLEINCWGSTYGSAKTLARAVIAALSAYNGTSGSTTFQNTLLDSEQDIREGGTMNQPEYLFRTMLDFIVWFEN